MDDCGSACRVTVARIAGWRAALFWIYSVWNRAVFAGLSLGCWRYWQPDLMPEIARGVRKGGIVALAGKTSGRFATSLANYRKAFEGWTEIASGRNEPITFFIAAKKLVD